MLFGQPRTAGEFEDAAGRVWENLPEQFREAACNVAIQIADVAEWDTLARVGVRDPYGLLGLYHGVALPFKSVGDLPLGPDMVFLYRIPILAFAHRRGEFVEAVIRNVLIHEIGHHFGFSDTDMAAIEAKASA